MKTHKLTEMTQSELNIFNNLRVQIDSVFKHSHECSIKTRYTYHERMDVFAKFLAVEYRKQNIKKISNDHILKYVEYLQERGMSTSYVTTSLSAIRYYYKKSVGSKFIIKSNKALGANARSKMERIGPDRSISESDYNELLKNTVNCGNKEYEFALKVGLTLGLRIHEFYKMRKSQIREALKTGEISVKGKGGLIRALPITLVDRALLNEILNGIESDNDRLFVKKREKTHNKIKELETYIKNSREGTDKNYVYHSLRHAYTQKLHKRLTSQGLSDLEARTIVSYRLGHGRVSISDIYLEAYE